MKQIKFKVQVCKPKQEVIELFKVKGRFINLKGIGLVLHKTIIYNNIKDRFESSRNWYAISEYTTGKNLKSYIHKSEIIGSVKYIRDALFNRILKALESEEVINYGK